MAIFLNSDSKVIVQGMTGSEGRKHPSHDDLRYSDRRRDSRQGRTGSRVRTRRRTGLQLGGASDGRTDADVTVIFVPAKFTLAAVVEAIEAGISLAVVITEGVPVKDTAEFFARSQNSSTRLIGPNCPGLISPGQSNAGIIPADITEAGRIGLVSKSGTLTYQMMYELRDIGFSSAVGIGGDPIIGTTHIDALQAFESDPDTDAIVMIGEIGGDAEERAADYIAASVSQARGRLCRRLHRTRGQDHGARRRDRLRIIRDSGRQAGGAGSCRSQSRQDAQRDRVLDARDRDEPLGGGPERLSPVDLGGALAGAYGHRVPLRAAEVVITLRVQEGVDAFGPAETIPTRNLVLPSVDLCHTVAVQPVILVFWAPTLVTFFGLETVAVSTVFSHFVRSDLSLSAIPAAAFASLVVSTISFRPKNFVPLSGIR